MGLSGRKVKQRIPNDPRNLSWADNAAKFGQSYLSKLGWDPSQGLGAEGAGRTSAVKISQKLDMLGIGMQHTRDANGIAWKQNRDFERLLTRLNGTGAAEASGVSGFDRAQEGSGSSDGEEIVEEEEEREETEKERRKREKRRKKSKSSDEHDAAAAEPAPAPMVAPAPVRAAPRSHRARNIAAKRLSSRTPAALSEILGIPSASLPATLSAASSAVTPPQEVAKLTDPNEGAQLENMTKLTTATQSVADYFKAKLAAKAGGSGRGVVEEEEEKRPRTGLGARAGLGSFGGREAEVGGLGFGMASKFAAMFAPRAEETKVEVKVDEVEVKEENVDTDKKSKEERRREKEERRKRKEKGRAKADTEGNDSPADKNPKKARDDEPAEDAVPASPVNDEVAETATKKLKRAKKDNSKPLTDEVETISTKKKRRKRDAEGGEERASKKRRAD